MPLRFDASTDSELILVTGDGESSVVEVLSVMDGIAGLGGASARWPIVADCRSFDYVASYEEARQIAARMRQLDAFRDRPIAVIVTTLAQLGLGRFVSALVGFGGVAMEVFRDEDAAKLWVIQQRAKTVGAEPKPPQG